MLVTAVISKVGFVNPLSTHSSSFSQVQAVQLTDTKINGRTKMSFLIQERASMVICDTYEEIEH